MVNSQRGAKRRVGYNQSHITTSANGIIVLLNSPRLGIAVEV